MGKKLSSNTIYNIHQCIFALMFFISVIILPRSKPNYYPKPWTMVMSLILPILITAFIYFKNGFSFFEKLYPAMMLVTITYNSFYVLFCSYKGRTCYSPYFFMYFLFATAGVLITLTLFRFYSKTLTNHDKTSYAIIFRNLSYILFPSVILVLIFVFIINREIGAVDSKEALNLIPTQGNIKQLARFFTSGFKDLESFYVFFGNIFLFSPIGFYINYYWKKSKKWFIIILPIFISASIELSQLLLNTGDPDIDDVILNVLGFYIGWFVYYLVLKKDKDIFEYEKSGEPCPPEN